MTLAGWCGCSPDPAVKPAPGTSKGGGAPVQSGAADVSTTLHFVDVTAHSEVDFSYRDGQEAGFYALVEILGGGVADCDFDGDGAPDLVFPGGGSFDDARRMTGRPPGYFRNAGGGQFRTAGAAAGLAGAPHYSHGAAAADYDNDGFADLLVTGYGGLALYRNQGDGTFHALDGPALGLDDTLWSSSAAWGDIDGDGNLDLYVVHYVDWSFENDPLCRGAQPGQRDLCTPKSFHALPHALYASSGDGRFQNVSRAAGLRDDGKGLGVVIADVDLDGRVDVYVGNDTTPNFLYHNLGGMKLDEIGQTSGTSVNDRGDPDGSMGVQVFDYNLDGLPDLWVANYEDELSAVYRNLGNLQFRHVSRQTGIAAAGGLYVGWGTEAADFDCDGDEDLFVANGHAIRYPRRAPLKQRPLLFENLRGERFANVTPRAGDALHVEHLGRGLAAADFDGDGDLDLVLSPINEPVQILANESRGPRHWLALRLIGMSSNRDAIGALVHLETANGKQFRQVKGGGSYASTSDRTVHFGLGDQAQASRIEIRWPSGRVQTLNDVRADRGVIVVEPR
ncbi:MAG: CRTAC1 family protein [Planctomycetia bacterium]|nr:CRTAC1 family protein [Planctomycetia bacterium]